MSWAEVQNLKDKMSALADATLYINVGKDYAGKTLMLKRYDSDYMSVTVGSQGTAEVSVQPKSRYELVTSDAADGRTSDVFYVEAGDYKEVNWDMGTFDGDTAIPINDVVLLQKCANIYNTYKYNTLQDVLADVACTTAILMSDNAVKYLKRCNSFADDFAANANAQAVIRSNNGVCKALASNITWATAFVTYYDKVFSARTPVVPTKASDVGSLSYTDPTGGVLTAHSSYATVAGENRVNGSGAYISALLDGTMGNHNTDGGNSYHVWVGRTSTAGRVPNDTTFTYKFPYSFILKKARVYNWTNTVYATTLTIEGSNDGVSWEHISSANWSDAASWLNVDVPDNSVPYTYYRIHTDFNNQDDLYILSEWNMYGVKA